MSFTPLGYIRLSGLSITFLTVAVVAIVLGSIGGLICGSAFGLTSCYLALTGGSAFTAMLLYINPLGTVFLTIIPRTLEGLLTGFIFKALHNNKKIQKAS